jgi:AGCS family alanine or glycine:cation symporter
VSPKLTIGAFRLFILALIGWASLQDLGTVFGFSDFTMGLLAVVNLLALWALYPVALKLLGDYERPTQQATPVFHRSVLPALDLDPQSWD